MISQIEEIPTALWQEDYWSIYRNALPQHPDRIDIARLEEGFAFSILDKLLKKQPFEIRLKPPFPIADILESMYFETRSAARVEGIQLFSLGYPLYIGKDEQGEAIAAPLFIWTLSVDPGAKQNGGWAISRDPSQAVAYNRFLVQHWEQNSGKEIRPWLEASLREKTLDAAHLIDICLEISGRLELENAVNSIAITDMPSGEELSQLKETGQLYWSGVLGLFAPHDLLFLQPAAAGKEQEPLPARSHSFGMLPLGPHQATAAARVVNHRLSLIEGPPGSGKTHLALHLLTNALSNGHRCLAVSSRLGALRALQEQLELLGLSRLSFLLRDAAQDIPLFLEILRGAANTKEPELSSDNKAFRVLATRAERLKNKLDSSYLSSRAPVFGTFNWTQTVGLYLRSIRKEGKELLSTQLHSQDYEFTFEEYQQLSLAIQSCQQLFKEAAILRSPLNKLHSGIFLRMEKEEALAFIEEQATQMLEKAIGLQHWYINRINTYSEMLSGHYEQHYQEYARRTAQLKDRVAEYEGRFGETFTKAGMNSLKVKSVFSGNAKALLAARQQVASVYESLRSDFTDNGYFEYSFPEADGGKDIASILDALKGFEQALVRWRSGLRDAVQEEIIRLSRKTANPRLGFRTEVEELEDSLDRLIERINESGLYQLPVSHKMLTLSKRQRFLDEVIEQMEVTRRSMEDFSHFYDWQRNWLHLSANARRLVKALIKVRTQNWQAAFESWFLDNCLSKEYKATLTPDPSTLASLSSTYEQLRPLMVPQTLLFWHREKENELRKLKRANRAAYQYLTGKRPAKEETPFRGFAREAKPAITSIMPALLVTPQLAGALFADSPELFDCVFVDEASFLHPREVDFLRGLGKQVVFFGSASLNEHREPPAALAYLKGLGATEASLYSNYRHYPGNLLQYENREVQPISRAEARGQFHFEQVDGRYDEQAESNEEEALHIIGLLNQIEKTPQRTYPSVGIACMTKGQRALIASYLLHIKQRRSPGVETIQQLERNGLAVLHLSELAGQRFDILIISGTYGMIDLKGGLTGHLNRLEAPQQPENILTLMSCAFQKVMVVNSIPTDRLEAWLKEPEPVGAALLAAYFLYIRAASEARPAAARAIVESLPAWMHLRSPFPQPTVFLAEISERLKPYLDPGRVQLEDGPVPLRIQAANQWQLPLFVAPDGFLSQSPATDYRWEYSQAEALESLGYYPISAWSADWWRNPGLEAKRMASQIIKMEQVPAPEEEE